MGIGEGGRGRTGRSSASLQVRVIGLLLPTQRSFRPSRQRRAPEARLALLDGVSEGRDV